MSRRCNGGGSPRYEERLEHAMRHSNIVRLLVGGAKVKELKHPPKLTDNGETAPEVEQAWRRVDEAMEIGGF